MTVLANTLVGDALRSARNKTGLSVNFVVEQLSNNYQICISSKTLYGWEAGRSQPDIDTFLALCQIYDVSILEFAKLGKDIVSNAQDKTILDQEEYAMMAKYRLLNKRGIEYIDTQLDFALSQEKYKLKQSSTIEKVEQVDSPEVEDEFVDIAYAAYGGESGTVTIPKKQFDEAMKALESYDYRKDM